MGNIVSQLHIHFVSRQHDDYLWPQPIWGNLTGIQLSEKEKLQIQDKVTNFLIAHSNCFHPA